MLMKSRVLWASLFGCCVLLFSACGAAVKGVPEAHVVPQDDLERARALITHYGCGACHTIPGVIGASSKVAPPLNDFYERSYIAGILPNTPDNLITWIQHPREIEPHTAMPDLGVTQAEATLIAAYLYHQPTLLDLLER
jgi:cytochrome c2